MLFVKKNGNYMDIDKKEINLNYQMPQNDEFRLVLKNLSGLVLLKYRDVEFTKIIELLNQIRPGNFLDILYISFIRSYKYMRTALEFNPLNEKRIFFIDCVSGYAFPDKDKIDDCFYHKPPTNIIDMEKVILFGIEKSNPDIVVIDSLSQYIGFSKSNTTDILNLIRSIKSLIEQKFNLRNIIFIILYDTRLGQIQDLSSISNSVDISLDI